MAEGAKRATARLRAAPAGAIAALLALVLFLAAAPAAAFEQLLDDAQAARLADGVHSFQLGDYPAAIEQFRTLAEAGVAEAQYYLGFMHAQGLGVEQDHATAGEWYALAAAQGHPQAQNYLGLLYFEGKGVARSFRDAFLYFELAAAAGNEDAANNRLIVARKMTSAQITEAQKAAGRIIAEIKSREKKVVLPLRLSSGVVVGDGSLVLTHADAVADCAEMTLRFADAEPRSVEIAVRDDFNGLALLSLGAFTATPLALRGAPVAPDEPLTVVGFGFDARKQLDLETTETQLQADPALSRVDERFLQLSTIVGASLLGAAVVDDAGALVGLMVPGLAPADVAQVRGVPGRDGFALRHELIRLLFETNGLDYDLAATETANRDEAIAAAGRAAVAIECWRQSESWPESDENAVPEPPAEAAHMRRRPQRRRRPRSATCGAASTSPAASCRCSTNRAPRSRRAPSAAA